jgi:site-specific DNA-methyltransferase (adenine-specific)
MIINDDCFNYLPNIESNSVDLILIDPPYLISKKSNFSKFTENINKEAITKFSNIRSIFGDWDNENLDWDLLFNQFNRILRKGGTLIIFYDIWKLEDIRKYADKYKLKQPRICSWIKTNPVPVNSKHNYLSNSKEFFFTFVKNGKPTFNSEYDNGIYYYPICNGKERVEHPTQKPLNLIKDLIKKHSNENDIVLDCFAGSGTTGIACDILKRKYILIEKYKQYYDLILKRIKNNILQ